MRVAVFTDNDFDKINGVTTTLRALLRCAPEDVAIRIYTAADVAVDTPDYFAAPSIGIGLPWYREMKIYWPRLQAWRRAMSQDGVDLVHVTTPGPVGLAGRRLARHWGVPLVGSYHTQFGDYAAAYSGVPSLGHSVEHYVRWFYHPCETVFVPSEATRHLLVDRGYRAQQLHVWSRGVDAQSFAPTRRSFTLRQRWRADEDRPVILYAGRLAREKGLDVVGPVRRALLRHGLQYRFVFAGDGPLRAELEAQCPDGIFLGSIPHDRMGAVMASADVFLFPSATDTLGNVVLEAQACGLPVVVSDRGGPQQHIAPEATGYVVRAGQSDEFARVVCTLVRHAERRRQMGQAAREYAAGRTWARTIAPLVEGWRQAIEPVQMPLRDVGRPIAVAAEPIAPSLRTPVL